MLEAGRERMAVNFETRNRHYVPFVAGQIASARARLTQEGEKTLGRQEEILTAARRAVELKAAGSDPMWRVFDKHRAALIAGQEEIRRVLLLTRALQLLGLVGLGFILWPKAHNTYVVVDEENSNPYDGL